MITVTKETAQALKEAGWDKECCLYYETEYSMPLFYNYEGPNDYFESYAPTAQEMLDEFPYDILEYCKIYFYKNFVQIEYLSRFNACGDNLAEALAKLWIQLKKENLITDDAPSATKA